MGATGGAVSGDLGVEESPVENFAAVDPDVIGSLVSLDVARVSVNGHVGTGAAGGAVGSLLVFSTAGGAFHAL
jgi:hypothetical protein